MKVSLIALYACCAVSSAAFAYQNNPQAGHATHSYATGTRGAQFARHDEPGIEPPHARVMDEPGIEPPHVKVMDEPGIEPPHVKVMDEPGIEPPHARVMDEPGIEPPHAAMQVASGLSPSRRH
jgi:hypothetical protein